MVNIRFIAVIPVVFSLLGAFMMLLLGAWKTIMAAAVFVKLEPADPTLPRYLNPSERMIIGLVESMDAFLIGLVMLMFAAGVYNLFISRMRILSDDAPWAWMRIDNIERLKQVLVEMILVVLAVLFLRVALFEAEELEWTVLVLPIGMALLAVAVRFVGWHGPGSRGAGDH